MRLGGSLPLGAVHAIDDHYADMSARGVQFVMTPPTDQPGGRRTAAFRDPAGQVQSGHR